MFLYTKTDCSTLNFVFIVRSIDAPTDKFLSKMSISSQQLAGITDNEKVRVDCSGHSHIMMHPTSRNQVQISNNCD